MRPARGSPGLLNDIDTRSHSCRPRCGLLHGLMALAIAAWCLRAIGAEVPVEPWADDGLQTALLGLKPGQVRSVRWTVQLFAPHRAGGAPIDVRGTLLEFDAKGQVEVLSLTQERQQESPQIDVYRYHRDAAGRVARIERSGSPGPLLERRFDGAGRLIEEDE